MTPNNIVNMAKLNGLDAIAVSDHNCTKNLETISKIALKENIIFLPGCEVESSEEIHVLCLFENVADAIKFDENVISKKLPHIKNNVQIFGEQCIFDELDNIIAKDDRYLINATTLSIDEIRIKAGEYGGIAIPAHIDKQSKSIMSVFGFVDKSMGFDCFELSKNVSDNFIDDNNLNDDNIFLYDSDAHYLWDINERNDKNFIEIDYPSARNIIKYLTKK